MSQTTTTSQTTTNTPTHPFATRRRTLPRTPTPIRTSAGTDLTHRSAIMTTEDVAAGMETLFHVEEEGDSIFEDTPAPGRRRSRSLTPSRPRRERQPSVPRRLFHPGGSPTRTPSPGGQGGSPGGQPPPRGPRGGPGGQPPPGGPPPGPGGPPPPAPPPAGIPFPVQPPAPNPKIPKPTTPIGFKGEREKWSTFVIQAFIFFTHYPDFFSRTNQMNQSIYFLGWFEGDTVRPWADAILSSIGSPHQDPMLTDFDLLLRTSAIIWGPINQEQEARQKLRETK